ncbi:small-subunit processome [Durotheca rogersii]|uniref:small-subunit processome n=1 Tax=Durotheca rogersii TaxID=419775 RepID=UPI00221E6307|nr:small-subunit processome [Durotheca rogersii]KAI5866102.1 small-subunit processome [Durotheca rogersii]
MPGRQAHGWPVGAPSSTQGKGKKRSKSKSTRTALDAFAIASKEYAGVQKRTPRNRELDAPLSGGRNKHARDDDDNDDDEDDDEAPPKKVRRAGAKGAADRDEEVEYGSDSSGNEWRIGGGDDDDSEIDSDEAFGESDEERFEGYVFRGSKKNRKAGEEGDEDDDNDDDDEDIGDADGASLGSDAIDLAEALDMSSSEDDGEPSKGQQGDGSSENGSASDDDDTSGNESSDIEGEDDDDDVSESGINAWVSQFSGVKDSEEQDAAPTTRPKVGLKDLGLLGIKDPHIKKSLKLMEKEQRSSKPQKLEVPLARRQQAKLDRSAAYEKTSESLDRWTETVKHNRRADHLVFPLPQTVTGLARHNTTELPPLSHKDPRTELERTIMTIMEESGLGPSAKEKDKPIEDLESGDAQGISRGNLKSAWQQRRHERELKSREDARAKRIKKIKSKSYHRVHRKQKEREEIKEREVMAAAGEIDSEEERDAQDRQRAMERMGARHRESKWAKMANKGRRAAWDDGVRTGIADMARRDEELRRRIEGKPSKEDDGSDEDSDGSGASDEGDERKRLLRQLDETSMVEDTAPKSKLMEMAFMKKAEAAKKRANDELVAQIRRELASDDEDIEESDGELDDVGRRKFGQASKKKPSKPGETVARIGEEEAGADLKAARDGIVTAKAGRSKVLSASAFTARDPGPSVDEIAGAWSQPSTAGPPRKQKGKKAGSGVEVLELGADSAAVIAPLVASAKAPKSRSGQRVVDDDGEANSSEAEDDDSPIEFREQELIEKAFGDLDVVAEFEQEKAAIGEADDDKVVDNTLPGWGGWVGDGISKREQKRHQGRFLTKKEGIKKQNRKDANLKNVIISERQVKKNNKYMASQLPHPYESRLQYERALRLPVGPEWMTKETFQQATKPRILLKQGVIAPIAKPTH